MKAPRARSAYCKVPLEVAAPVYNEIWRKEREIEFNLQNEPLTALYAPHDVNQLPTIQKQWNIRGSVYVYILWKSRIHGWLVLMHYTRDIAHRQ